MTGKSFSRIQTEDAELLGIANVLSVSSGLAESFPLAAKRMIREERLFHPDEEKLARYTDIFKTYKQLQRKLYRSY